MSLVLNGYVVSVVNIAPGLMLAALDTRSSGAANSLLHLYRIQLVAGSWRAQMLPNLSAVQGVTVDHNGSAVFRCPAGLCELSKQQIRDWGAANGLAAVVDDAPAPVNQPEHVIRDHLGCLWFGTQTATSFECPGESRQTLPPAIASLQPWPHITETGDGSMVIPSIATLSLGRFGKFRTAEAENGYPSANDALEGQDGTIWAGGGELVRFAAPFRLEYWTGRDGLNSPFSVLHLADGKVLAATGKGIVTLTVDRSHWIPVPNTAWLGIVLQLSEGPNGTIFANGQRLAQLRPDGTIVARYQGANKLNAFRLAQAADGQLWLAGRGVSRVVRHGDRLDIVPDVSLAGRGSGFDIEFEKTTKTLWACDGGLEARKGSSWLTIATPANLVTAACRSIAPLPNGDVWYGYNFGGDIALIRQHPLTALPASVRNFHVATGEGEVTLLSADPRGWLWRGASEGMFVADPASAEHGEWPS